MKYDVTISDFIGLGNASYNYLKWRLSEAKGKEVNINICSLGGYVDSGLRIYELFKEHGNVNVTFTACSASAATLLAMGAKKVTAAKHSLMLIHNASFYVWTSAQMNKEDIDKYIEDLKLSREQLKTFDDVLAAVYAERSGKPIEEIMSAMKKAAWMKAEDALELGIIDAIDDEKEAAGDKKDAVNVAAFASQVTNDMLKELGLPLLPEQDTVTDEDNKPSLLGRVAAVVKGLAGNNNNSAAEEKTKMKTIFKAIGLLLAMTLEMAQDEKKEFTHDELKKIEDDLNSKATEIENLKNEKKAAEDSVADRDRQIKDLNDELTKLKNDIQTKDEQIKNLKEGVAKEEEPLGIENETTGLAFAEMFK